MPNEPVVQAPPAAAPAPVAPPAAAPPAPASTATAGTPPAVAAWMAPPAGAGAPPAPAKPAEAATAPPKIELKVPDGFKMEPDALGKYATFATENGLSQAQAQKLLERDLTGQKATEDAEQSALREQDKKWIGELQTAWGTKFAENSELAKRGFDVLDPDGQLRAGIEKIHVAHWPQLVRAAERLGRMVAEDKLHAPNAGKTEPKMSPEEKIKQGYVDGGTKGAKK